MPYKSDMIRLPKEYDRRIKFTEEKKRQADLLISQGESITKTAKILGISKRLLQFYLFPERHEKNLLDRKINGGSKIYNNREKHTKAIANLRRYKHELFIQGKIKIDSALKK
jgi:transposase-like protein